MNDRSNKSSALFTPSGCLTGDALMLFVTGSLKGVELAIANQHITECPLCADAADGLRMWLAENKTDKTSVPDLKKLPDSPVSVVTSLKKANAEKALLNPLDEFHTRTDLLNERIKQRLHAHALIYETERKRLSYKPFVWLSAAATLVLFIGGFYVVWIQNQYDKQKLAQKEEDTMELFEQMEDSLIKPASDTADIYILALNKKSKAEEKQSLNLVSSDNEGIASDIGFFNEYQLMENVPAKNKQATTEDEENLPAYAGQPEKADTSGIYNMNEPTAVSGVVVTALGISREKKSLGYSTQDKKNVEAVTTREMKGIKIRTLDEIESEEDDATVFTIVEQMPVFPGGQEKMLDFLSENLKYPDSAKESGIHGTVYISFVVRKDGTISDVKVLRSIGGGCDEEAVRVVKKMPHWKPATQRGKKVDVVFTIPVVFKLD